MLGICPVWPRPRERQADALKQAEEAEFAFRLHFVEHVVVGKSATRMITPSHRVRKPLGRRSKISCAIASISASDGAFVVFHIAPV